jgi:hypothetical protein
MRCAVYGIAISWGFARHLIPLIPWFIIMGSGCLKVTPVANLYGKSPNSEARTPVSKANRYSVGFYHILQIKLQNEGEELCQAVLAIDRGIFEAATERKIRLNVLKSLAVGNEYCDGIYAFKE